MTALNLSCPAVSQICSLIFWPLTSIILVPNSTPIVWGQSAITVVKNKSKDQIFLGQGFLAAKMTATSFQLFLLDFQSLK